MSDYQQMLDLLPAMAAPDGQTSNFVNPPSLFAANLATSFVCLIVTLIFFGIRAYTKCFLLKRLYLEDYNFFIAMALFCSYIGIMVWAAYSGGGRHQWDVSVNQAMHLIYIATIVETVYCVNMAFAKVALLQQIRRIFSGSQRNFVYIASTTLIWLNVLFYIAAACANTFACSPREAEWDPLVPGTCINYKLLIVASSAINILSDFSILVIPVACTWNLVLPTRRKLGVFAVFATGAFCCATSVVRMVLAVPVLTVEDIIYTLMPIGLWSIAELSTAIICGCMTCVPRFLQHFRPPSDSEPSRTSGPSRKSAGASPAMNAAAAAPECVHPAGNSTNSSSREAIFCEKPRLLSDGSTAAMLPAPQPSPLPSPPPTPLVEADDGRPAAAAADTVFALPSARRSSHSVPRRPRTPGSDFFVASDSRPLSLRGGIEVRTVIEVGHPALPPAAAHLPRRPSLSARASTPTGQQALQALAGRFWRDAPDRGRRRGTEEV